MAHSHAEKPLGPDVHSYANFNEAQVSFLDISLRVDFDKQRFFGFVDVHVDILKDNTAELLLDTKNLAIESVENLQSKKFSLWTLPAHHEALGVCLKIPFEPAKKGDKLCFRIKYSTTPESGGIQWLEPSQTSSKKYHFAYTQCEAILSRTLLPNQDTPNVKIPYAIKVSVPSPYVAACSGQCVREFPTIEDDGYLTYEYKQPNPIPSYLIAIVVGKLAKASVGPRSSVWCEPELLKASVHEFEAETEAFIKAGEEITGIKYEWGVYDMVILPAAFPYGGMENPNLTFLSSSLLAGDRSLTNVVAHEITHSWAGNLVTNGSWQDFWLNEGFTVYIERLILGKIRNSEHYRHFEILCGFKDLTKTVQDIGKDHEYTKLCPNLTGVDPDDAFSKIPYEKGSLFLFYLEQLVGGPEPMKRWLKSYFTTFSKKALNSEQMKAHFLNYFTSEEKVEASKLSSIDWNHWWNQPGMPNFDPSKIVNRDLVEKCEFLFKVWTESAGEGSSESDLQGFQAKQIMYFLDLLILNAMPLSPQVLEKLNEKYHLSTSSNVEVAYRWLMIALKSHYSPVYQPLADFLSKYGRGLYVRPLYKALMEVNMEVAKKIYNQNRNYYHSVIRNMFDRQLLVK